MIRMPATYAAVKETLKRLCQHIEVKEEEIQDVIDIGAGTGAATWAIKDQWPKAKITCIERDGQMKDLGEKLLGKKEEIYWIQEDVLTNKEEEEKADLVMESYLLNEFNRKRSERCFSKNDEIISKMDSLY